jgi:hypothetical protein
MKKLIVPALIGVFCFSPCASAERFHYSNVKPGSYADGAICGVYAPDHGWLMIEIDTFCVFADQFSYVHPFWSRGSRAVGGGWAGVPSSGSLTSMAVKSSQ